VNNCEWQGKIALYVDGELDPAMEQDVARHLASCSDCSGAVLEQQELKKAVRLAAKRFSPPPELYASVRRQMAAKGRPSPWMRWSVLATTIVLLAVVSFGWYSRSAATRDTVSQLVDQHVTMLASANPVDIISEDTHNVKPWFQGKLPFTFNPAKPDNSSFKLLGGKLVYARQAPGAELVYQVRQHKISVFIFQARDVHGAPSAGDHAFTVSGWQQGGLQYYIVTDAAREDADRLRSLLEEANRS
jgi:anti-sigma factor RsiW